MAGAVPFAHSDWPAHAAALCTLCTPAPCVTKCPAHACAAKWQRIAAHRVAAPDGTATAVRCITNAGSAAPPAAGGAHCGASGCGTSDFGAAPWGGTSPAAERCTTDACIGSATSQAGCGCRDNAKLHCDAQTSARLGATLRHAAPFGRRRALHTPWTPNPSAAMAEAEPPPQPKRPRICLITGASRGLGRAVALEYARQGARLVLVGAEQDEQELEQARRGAAQGPSVAPAPPPPPPRVFGPPLCGQLPRNAPARRWPTSVPPSAPQGATCTPATQQMTSTWTRSPRRC